MLVLHKSFTLEVAEKLIILEVKPKLRKPKPKTKVLISQKGEDQVPNNLDMFHHFTFKSNHIRIMDKLNQDIVKKE